MSKILEFLDFTSFEEIKSAALKFSLVGSRATCNPPPTDTDEDWLLLLGKESVAWALLDSQWEHDGSRIDDRINKNGPEGTFHSYSSNGVNVIATASKEFYRRFMAASSIAKRFNLLVKSDRVVLFQAVLYGNEDEANSLRGSK
ncbi:MAG: hypothetical protein P4L10_11130 [Acidobacteriaceae bacterium]|nr:hypothetical protein [Acidobacteriaceae bacterium]